MANSIPERMVTGAFGELFVQLRLLQYGIQAAPPLKDTGNDLIAIKGKSIKCIQVKTTRKKTFNPPSTRTKYHLLAIVALVGDGENVLLDKSRIYLIKKEDVNNVPKNVGGLKDYRISQELLNKLFAAK
ncbi:MAG: hypothetical protein KAJ18_10855 [Candidatus Omnitrophica bacterium]|nr:hypothetical protein [Candidatus Omnitrophota bacterium]